MIFWIEDNIEITYNELVLDLKNEKPKNDLKGYNFIVSFLSRLLTGAKFSSIENIVNYIQSEKDKLSFRIQTSGTTSTPKNVDVIISNCIRHVKVNNESCSDRIWGMGYPVASFASTQVLFQSLMNKEAILYLFNVNFNSLDELLLKYKITNLSCTPTFLSMMLINMKELNNSVKKITTGGEKIRDNLIVSFKKTFINAEYINIYASSETGSLLRSNSEFFSIPQKYQRYLKIEEGTLRVHKNLLNSSSDMNLNNGWFDTNDQIEWVDENQFRFVSRSNGYLNTGGYRVSPHMVEELILNIKNVIDVHVYGKTNSLLGVILCADVIGSNIDSKSIKSEMKKLTDKHNVPQIVRVVEQFEHVFNGKRKLII